MLYVHSRGGSTGAVARLVILAHYSLYT